LADVVPAYFAASCTAASSSPDSGVGGKRSRQRGLKAALMSRILGSALLLALAPLTGCGGDAVSVPAPLSGTGLFVSDFHFNPLADKTLADRLAQAPASQWDSIFATSTETACSPYGHDTNFPLLQSALAAMRQQVPDPDIVFVSGDFLVHEFQLFFNARVTDHSPAAYTAFVNTTEQYLAMKLSQTFPKAQIVPTLGDWDTAGSTDSYAGSDFLASFSSAWNAAVNRYGGAPDFQTTCAAGGYYSTTFPIDPRGRLIVLYTQPWAAECTDGCAPGPGSLGTMELEWLAAQLDDARSHGQRVWLLGHIPPGITAGGTLQNIASGVSCVDAISPFWADAYSNPLYALFERNRDLLTLGIFAHEHDEDYRAAWDSSGHVLFGIKLVPSVTPLESNNPAFVRFEYNPIAGVISDATTWYLTNLPSAPTPDASEWGFEYDFDITYGQNALDSIGVAGAVTRILTQANAQSAYTTYYPSSNQEAAFTTFLPYGCALNNLTVADYSACYCGQ
jgi:sphingomyelin phosphodiesterase acid-like 3